jgi:hypothetical protein
MSAGEGERFKNGWEQRAGLSSVSDSPTPQLALNVRRFLLHGTAIRFELKMLEKIAA